MSLTLYRIFSEEDALKLRDAALAMEWRPAHARTEYGSEHIKRNLELVIKPEIAPLVGTLQKAIFYNQAFQEEHFPYKILPPIVNRYNVDSPEFKRHGDSALLAGEIRTDISCTLFLTPPDQYEGGVLTTEGGLRVKGEAGTAVVYDGGQPHWVTPVTSGERICAVTWIQSYIRDPQKRRMLAEMRRIIDNLGKHREDWEDEYTSLGIVQSNLIRMWMEQ